MPVREERRYALLLRVLVLAALLLRLFFVLVLHPPRAFIFSDMQSYDLVAFEILSGNWNAWHAFRPVGYSWLLAFAYALTDGSRTFIGVLQALMGAALVPMCAQLARAAGAGRSTALVVAALVATSLPLILYSGLILTEIPSAFFFVLGLKLLFPATPEDGVTAARRTQRKLVQAGLCLGVAGAVRPNFLLAYPLVLLYLAFTASAWHHSSRVLGADTGRAHAGRLPALGAWLPFVLSLALPLALVSAYNSHVLGRLVGPSANGGLNFYLNFADVHTVRYEGALGIYWISPVPNGFDHTRVELTNVPLFEDAHYYARGLAYLGQHPRALLEALQNFPEAFGIGRQLLWPGWPGHEHWLGTYNQLFFALVLVPALGALLLLSYRAYRRRASAEASTLAALCASSALPIYLFLGDPRLRVPFDPLWIVLAGLFFQALTSALLRSFRRTVTPRAP